MKVILFKLQDLYIKYHTIPRTISDLVGSLKREEQMGNQSAITQLRSLLNDSASLSQWLEENLALDRKTVEMLLGSHVRQSQVRDSFHAPH